MWGNQSNAIDFTVWEVLLRFRTWQQGAMLMWKRQEGQFWPARSAQSGRLVMLLLQPWTELPGSLPDGRSDTRSYSSPSASLLDSTAGHGARRRGVRLPADGSCNSGSSSMLFPGREGLPASWRAEIARARAGSTCDRMCDFMRLITGLKKR